MCHNAPSQLVGMHTPRIMKTYSR